MANFSTPGKHLFLENRTPLASSTPSEKLNKSRPIPHFLQNDNHKLFQFKSQRNLAEKALQPKSPVKSAPPISRVFPHRSWAPEKAHAVSFRLGEETVDSTMFSRFYNSESSQLYFEQCFIIEKKLGEGSFGEVMQVRSRDNWQQYAVKRSREKFRSESDRKRKLDEVKKHEQLPSHPNCVKFIKAWEEKHRLYIQTELCQMSLLGYLEKHQQIPNTVIWRCLIDLLKGLNHIHSHGFIHFDVKPANIFLTNTGRCKIGDFGLVVDRSNDDITNAREGDNKYMAPELLDGVFSDKADVFSLGIAILEISCNLELPSSGLSWQLLRQGYIPPECVSKMPHDLYVIVKLLMTPNHVERPTISEILSHPIVSKQSWKLWPYTFVLKLFVSFWAVIQFVLLVFLTRLLKPLQYFKQKIPLRPIFSNKSLHDAKAWDSSTSTLSSFEGEYVNELLDHTEHEKSNMFLTPDVHNRSYSKFTPTPRNSSPMANRMGKPVKQESPDISPLSHSKHRLHKKALLGRTGSEDFEFFLSDNSENEQNSEDEEVCKEKFICSKPRNLLDMLNDVSDSENSNNG